jgi:hypothetical protein
MSLHSGNGSKHLTKNEDKILVEISLFTELIKDESVIDSMIRALRYERNQKKSPTWTVQPSQTSYETDCKK